MSNDPPIMAVPPAVTATPPTAVPTRTLSPHSFEKPDEKSADVNAKLFESTRSELIQRIILRDTCLLFYIGAVGSYFNQAVSYHFSDEVSKLDLERAILLMIPLPLLCSMFSLIVLQHHMTVGKIGSFLRSEFDWGKLDDVISKHWDNSDTFLTQANLLIRLRLYGQGLILTLPLFYVLVFFFRFKDNAAAYGWLAQFSVYALVIVDVATTLFIGWLHLMTHNQRKREWAINRTPRPDRP